MAQQKQRKQLILSNNQNISTYHLEPIQRLQPNFLTNGIRNFMYSKHNGDNAKLRISLSYRNSNAYNPMIE